MSFGGQFSQTLHPCIRASPLSPIVIRTWATEPSNRSVVEPSEVGRGRVEEVPDAP